ncbi:MAG: helix-turn-helix domain-containing protein, partial [Thermocrispum sp.]
MVTGQGIEARRAEVARLTDQNLSQRAIAEQLGISRDT